MEQCCLKRTNKYSKSKVHLIIESNKKLCVTNPTWDCIIGQVYGSQERFVITIFIWLCIVLSCLFGLIPDSKSWSLFARWHRCIINFWYYSNPQVLPGKHSYGLWRKAYKLRVLQHLLNGKCKRRETEARLCRHVRLASSLTSPMIWTVSCTLLLAPVPAGNVAVSGLYSPSRHLGIFSSPDKNIGIFVSK